MIKIIAIISGILFSSISFANSQNQNLEKRFIDLTNTMTAEQSEYIEKQLDNVYNQNSKMDFEIILTDTSDNQSINDLSTNLFNHYKLGNNPLNNGLLILIAKNDRTYSIKPGLGINGLFPKNIVDDFGNDCFKPNFRENNYYTGINCAINKTNIILEQNNNVTTGTNNQINNQSTEQNPILLYYLALFTLLFAILFFFFIKKQIPKNKKYSFEDNYNNNHQLYYAPHRANITNQDNNNNNNNNIATSKEYLEKIFQIPFHLQNMEEDVKKKQLEYLMENDLKYIDKKINDDVNENNIEENLKIDSVTTLKENSSFSDNEASQDNLHKELKIEQFEYDYILKNAKNLGETPRSIKRFINIYRIIRSHEYILNELLQKFEEQYKFIIMLLCLNNKNDNLELKDCSQKLEKLDFDSTDINDFEKFEKKDELFKFISRFSFRDCK